ncbi:MAG: Na+/H+ antiporter subunit E [Candidatus Omnitrophica bacterium]|nr:Na+/H+ antiporter subunit E [Candidatus Omnitrophota bacterium]
MASRIIFFIVGFLVWCLLNWKPNYQEIIIGVIAAAGVAYLTGDLFTTRPALFKNPRRYIWILYYIPLFLWECLKANLDIAIRIIRPSCPIYPGIVKVKTSLKTDIALTCLANSITLTPGTLTVDIDKEKRILYVHWINVKSKDTEKATEIIVKRFEKILTKIFE